MSIHHIRGAGIAAALIALLCLGACGRMVEDLNEMASEQSAKMSLVLPGGKTFMVDGQPTLVFGVDQCPQGQDGLQGLIGSPSDAGDRSCIVIDPQTDSVRVRMVKQDGSVQITDSMWAIKREGNHGHAIHLMSAKGNPIYEVEKSSGT